MQRKPFKTVDEQVLEFELVNKHSPLHAMVIRQQSAIASCPGLALLILLVQVMDSPCTETPNPWYRAMGPPRAVVFFRQSTRPVNSRSAPPLPTSAASLVLAKSNGYTMSREPAPARPPAAMLTAKNLQKSVFGLYLGNKFLIVSCNKPLHHLHSLHVKRKHACHTTSTNTSSGKKMTANAYAVLVLYAYLLEHTLNAKLKAWVGK